MLDELEEALTLIKEWIEQQGDKAQLIDSSIGTGVIMPLLKADIGCDELSKWSRGPSGGVAGYRPDRGKEAVFVMAKGIF